jgi:squalene synthase HpnC
MWDRRLPPELRQDYARCAQIARHAENFTVASRVLPRGLRAHLTAIYAYCRGVDDLGDTYTGDRLAALAAWERQLDDCFAGHPRTPVFRALAHTVERFQLPQQPFLDLITANRMDQQRRHYATFADLRAYCRCSAEPVGRLVLALFGIRGADAAAQSDDTCTALQLTNFWQDLGSDLARGRLYLPLEDMERFGLRPQDLPRAGARPALRRLLAFEVARTRALFRSGAALEARVPWRLGLQLRLYRLGGEAVLGALERQGLDPLTRRPHLGAAAKAAVALRAVLSRPSAARGGICHDAGPGL